jgi:1-deoxy-D-xylulose-5-phosphate reductoisomerase
MVKLALLGATGSIGRSTLAVAREQAEHFSLSLISAHTDWQSLCHTATEFQIPVAVLTGIGDPALRATIRAEYPALRIYFGEEDLLRALADEDYDIGLNAISGSAGLRSSFAIARRGKRLALANKESLVLAGHLLMPLIKDSGTELVPVDSEHSAIFQAIGNHPAEEIRRIHITASGGSLRDLPLAELEQITLERALKHPNWSMGAKVTLDSATMFNKALEVMEAHWLFGLPYDRINALLHPQSLIHSLVEFVDGSILAQLSTPDMKLPILYALSWPHRLPSELTKTDLTQMGELSFAPIGKERYPLFWLGLEVAREGGILPTVLNSANEGALHLFQQGRIKFTDIHRTCERMVQNHANVAHPDLAEVLETNRQVYLSVVETYG